MRLRGIACASQVKPDDPAPCNPHALATATEIIMTLTFSRTIIEVTRTHAYARIGGREGFVKFGSGLPLGFISKERQTGSLEVWGLGMYAVVSKS